MANIVYLKHKFVVSDVVYKVWVSYENEKRWVGTCCGNAQPFEKHLYELTDERPAYERPDFYKQPLMETSQPVPVSPDPIEADLEDLNLPASGAWF